MLITRGRHAYRAKHRNGYDGRWEAPYKWVFMLREKGCTCKFCGNFDTPEQIQVTDRPFLREEECSIVCMIATVQLMKSYELLIVHAQ